MSNPTPQALAAFIASSHAATLAEEQRLNAADAKLGDGDTGSMLRRVLAAMEAAPTAHAGTFADAAMGLAQAAMKETGSSLGTLIATAAMTLGKAAKAAPGCLAPEDMGRIVAEMRDAVAARGKASLGDKTVLDSLDAIASALDAGPASCAVAARAAKEALYAFRDRPCRIGRARMFPERSIGADDPGMLAVALILNYETGETDA